MTGQRENSRPSLKQRLSDVVTSAKNVQKLRELTYNSTIDHWQSYACKVGVGDVLICAAQTAAEFNRIATASHIRDKIIEMNHLNETLYWLHRLRGGGYQEASGTYMVDTLLANVHKQNITCLLFEQRRQCDTIGGFLLGPH
jgi:4-hydroxybutyryl-CoA dehydratase / vinylacetyl-CoA-Delta-isomerase